MKIRYEDGFMKGYLKDWVSVTVVIAVVLLVFAGLMVGMMTAFNHATHVACLRYHEQTGLTTQVRGTVDAQCFVLVPGVGWVLTSQYVGVDTPVVTE